MDENLEPTKRDRHVLVAVLALMAVVAIAVLAVSVFTGNAEDAPQTSGYGGAVRTPITAPASTPASTIAAATGTRVEVDMNDISFSPNLVTIPAGTPVTVVIVNHSAIAHNFSITDHKNPGVKNLNISIDVDPGKTQTVTINAPAGRYYFYCDVPGHEQAGMNGFFEAKSGGSGGGA